MDMKHFRIINKIKLNVKKDIQKVGTDLLIVRPECIYLDLNLMAYYETHNCLEQYLNELK
jgi:delta-aminolevulinic acid dehydratase/porphobilinogen synthase